MAPTGVSGRAVIAARFAEAGDLVVVALDALLPRADGPEAPLMEAMRYAVLGPGRRLHPFFAIESARLFDVPDRAVLRAACAMECVRVAALVQDDLPAMNDRSVRDGRQTLHRQYDAPTALLAGDGLRAAAAEIMAHRDTHDDGGLRAELVRRLAVASGARGLAGGRMIDRLGVGDDLGAVARMQRMRTGALTTFAFEIGLCLARVEGQERTALTGFAQDFSLAYEIEKGLQVKESSNAAKATNGGPENTRTGSHLVALLGPQAARERRAMLAAQCRSHLDIFGERARYLRDSVNFVLERRA